MNAPKVPDPKSLANVQKICDLSHPFDFPADHGSLFVAAMREITAWHAKGSDFYKKMLNSRDFDPSSIQTEQDLSRIPFIPANFFKAHEILSIPHSDISMHFTSSGTSGQKSQMFFDSWSLASRQRMVDFTFEAFGWRAWGPSQLPTLYL